MPQRHRDTEENLGKLGAVKCDPALSSPESCIVEAEETESTENMVIMSAWNRSALCLSVFVSPAARSNRFRPPSTNSMARGVGDEKSFHHRDTETQRKTYENWAP